MNKVLKLQKLAVKTTTEEGLVAAISCTSCNDHSCNKGAITVQE